MVKTNRRMVIMSISAGALALLFGGMSWAYLDKCKDLVEADAQYQELKVEYDKVMRDTTEIAKENIAHEEELKRRDETLEKYRNELDRLEKIERTHKECPTQQIAVSRGSSTREPVPSSNTNSGGQSIEMTLTFYGDGADENGGYAGITAWGEKLRGGMVASNVYPKGTRFEMNGMIFTVADRGGSGFNSKNRLDVFVPRKSGESNSAYKARISEYGKRTVTMKKL